MSTPLRLSLLACLAALAALTACGGGGSGDSAPTAAECFNPALYGRSQVRYTLTYKLGGSQSGTYTRTGTNFKTAPQDPRPLWIVAENETTVLDGQAAGTAFASNVTYGQNIDGNVVVSRIDTTYPDPDGNAANARILTVYNPPRSDPRFTLAAGQSGSIQSTATRTEWTGAEWAAANFGDTGGRSQTLAISTQVTFRGLESVSVPAGTVTACRFEESGGNATATAWYAKDTGELVKLDATEGNSRRVLELSAKQ